MEREKQNYLSSMAEKNCILRHKELNAEPSKRYLLNCVMFLSFCFQAVWKIFRYSLRVATILFPKILIWLFFGQEPMWYRKSFL